MNQGKLDMFKQMVRISIDILGISALKRMGMSEFNSDEQISTTVGKNPLEEMKYFIFQAQLKYHCLHYVFSISWD